MMNEAIETKANKLQKAFRLAYDTQNQTDRRFINYALEAICELSPGSQATLFDLIRQEL